MSNKSPGGIMETVKTVVYALLLAGLIRTLFFQPFWIPSGSMKPTLLVGDFLFVNKMAYGYSKHSCPFSMCPFSGRIFGTMPEAGDIVVFKHPTSGEDYIKRLIGLPGDRIQMKNGQLFINNDPSPLAADGKFVELYDEQGPLRKIPSCTNQSPILGQDSCEKDLYWETLPNGVTHAVLDTFQRSSDNTPLYTVPAEHFFFMGDNRDNSADSRFRQGPLGGVGYVPFDLLVGRADRVIFSSAGRRILFFWTWRKDRFFKALQ